MLLPTKSLLTYTKTWIALDRQAFTANALFYKKIIGKSSHLAVVVKSNAYGHGLFEIADLCQKSEDIDWLCTATLSDALLLRSKGITKPILVLSIIDDLPEKACEHDIDLVVYNCAMLEQLERIGESFASSPSQNPHARTLNIHIKVDTGLSRFGFLPEQLLAITHRLKNLKNVVIRGIFTHFSESDNEDQKFTQEQVRKFNDLVDELEKHGIKIPLRHRNNTAATTVAAGLYTHTNFVRVGAGIYGLEASSFVMKMCKMHYPNFVMKQVLTWKARIIEIRTIKAGSFISYARTYQTTRDTKIALLPVGYYDGYSRRLGNKGIVGIVSKNDNASIIYAPVLGRICMNVMIIDITDIPGVALDDEVILLGNFPSLRAHDLANLMESFNPREITVNLGAHIPRFYS